MIRLAISGTDTGVGKTVVACAIAAACVARDLRVGVMKPAETGVTDPATTGVGPSAVGDTDASQLIRASRSSDPLSVVRPYAFPAPLAPIAAARLVEAEIALPVLDRAFQAACAGRDIVVVEGAGGLLVPLTTSVTFATLFSRWRLRLVIVAANRLGVVNHTLLTVRAAEEAGLEVVAIVLNDTCAARPDESVSGNAQLITEFVGQIPVVRFPWMPHISDHQALACMAESSGLMDVIAAQPHFPPNE